MKIRRTAKKFKKKKLQIYTGFLIRFGFTSDEFIEIIHTAFVFVLIKLSSEFKIPFEFT